jgi:N-acetylmuramoyl-L-alanine amidase
MANSNANKSLNLKQIILREVYADNLNTAGENHQPLKQYPGLTSKRLERLLIRHAKAFLLLLAFSALGVFSLHPQVLRSIGFGSPNKDSFSRLSTAFTGAVDLSQRPAPLSVSLPAGRDPHKESSPELETGGEHSLFNTPQDYSGLVGPMPVSIAALFDLGVKTIAIDPGHGGRDPGAIGPNGLQEKVLTLDIARRLRDRLKQHWNYRIVMIRDEDISVSLKRRAEIANENRADLFISIHVNYIPVEPVMIIETYFFGAHAGEEEMRIAEKENQGSEYLMAEFRSMIEKISNNFKQQESKSLALCIQESLFQNIRNENGRKADRGIKSAPFVVLLGTNMPSVLAEVTCISNKKEEERLADPAYREEIAAYLEVGIVKYLEKSRKEPIEGGREHVKKR